ncbi:MULTISPECIES: DUF1489 family protein [Sphingobium]|jgi:hypothetical protein|uniref:DUF1489 family protein n=1 Tax=Sphingobium TaxID=165695 RepID=UPI000DBAE83F|nr:MULTISPECIES: DUF1489 domain-containing protein [Sphingobium]KAA9015723.1 DUF1489 family protein [Sphingobium limneticum]MBU0932055.1 DUF1489 domain-containing protein [Alphaproteobacteria bacterium]BBD01534.1 hypothetical protein YGS_C1P2789 [Sphingobium sp. YG1]
MPLHMTKIAFGAESPATLRAWLESHDGEARTSTRYLPKRVEEMAGGSLFWIHGHMLVGRSPIIGFEETGQGRYWIRLEPKLIPVRAKPKRAHQGWRYLEDADAPADLEGGEADDLDAMPPALMSELTKLGLV